LSHRSSKYSLALHDALPILDEGLLLRTPDGKYRLGLVLWELAHRSTVYQSFTAAARPFLEGVHQTLKKTVSLAILDPAEVSIIRSEEHTSELQSRFELVFRL